MRILDETALKYIPERIKNANKGSYGHVLVIAGSNGMSGAAFLSAMAAYRSGAGLVRILTVSKNRTILQTLLPEAIITTYDEREAYENKECFINKIKSCIDWSSVVVLGPGLSTDYYAKIIVEYVLAECYVPMIIDADALNIIAADTTLTKYYTDNIIITPHIGEMSRLIDISIEDILSDPVKYAEEYANKYGITVVLKSHQSVIAAKEDTFINKSGSAAMAKAGSGDVLCGIIAGMFCLGIDDDMAVALGVFIHGMAGSIAGKKHGEHSILAREIIDNIGEVLNRRKRNGLI